MNKKVKKVKLKMCEYCGRFYNVGNKHTCERARIDAYRKGYEQGQVNTFDKCINALLELGCAENGDEVRTLIELKEHEK